MGDLLHYLVVYGTPLVFANVLLEQLGLPIPALPTLIAAGALVRDGRLSAGVLLTWAVIASLIADWLWYELGRRHGFRMLRLLCRISLSPDSCVRETESLFERWGLPSLVVAKFVPGFSTVAPPLAGAMRGSRLAFLFFDFVGALAWVGSGLLTGFVFRRVLHQVFDRLDRLGWWSIIVIVSALLLIILIKWWQRLRFYKRLRMARISPAELKQMIEDGQTVVVLDVRSSASRSRDRRRIPGALVLKPDEIEQRLEHIAPHQEIILYCT
jgi:membrane protein DedA with SNARE-associated domain